jgi:hypothetical protein
MGSEGMAGLAAWGGWDYFKGFFLASLILTKMIIFARGLYR